MMRFLGLILVALFCITFSGCSGKPSNNSADLSSANSSSQAPTNEDTTPESREVAILDESLLIGANEMNKRAIEIPFTGRLHLQFENLAKDAPFHISLLSDAEHDALSKRGANTIYRSDTSVFSVDASIPRLEKGTYYLLIWNKSVNESLLIEATLTLSENMRRTPTPQ